MEQRNNKLTSQERWNRKHRKILNQSEHKYYLKNRAKIARKNKIRMRKIRKRCNQ